MQRGVSRLSVWISIAALGLCGCGDDGDDGGTRDESECGAKNPSCKDSGPREVGGSRDSETSRDAGQNAGPDANADAALDAGTADPETDATFIGAAGGVVTSPDGASVEIPAGALSRDVRIEIHHVEVTPLLPQGMRARGLAYAVEPHGTRFAKPVTLRLPYTGDSTANLTALRLDDPQDTSWELAPGGQPAADHALELTVSRFSIYQTVQLPKVVEVPDAAVPESCDVDNGGCGDPTYVTCNEETGGGVSCDDVDECVTDNGGCDPLVTCSNQLGAPPLCGDCPAGHSGTGATSCVAIDECAAGAVAACGEGALACDELTDGYTCTCDSGYLGTGTQHCSRPTACPDVTPDPSETCYSFRAHDVSSAYDTTKAQVAGGEALWFFYYGVPWATGSVGSRVGFTVDHASVVSEAVLFDTIGSSAPGTVTKNVTGTVLGESAAVIGTWGPGGCDLVPPAEVGLHLPGPSGKLLISMHYDNATGSAQLDASGFTVCTVAAASRTHTAGLTILGTEDLGGVLGMPPGMSSFSGTCPNDSSGPITILSLTPDARRYATQMRVEATTEAGTVTLLDQPYDVNYQVHYEVAPPFVLQPGEDVTARCTYSNTSSSNVAFGVSDQQEQCYVFALSYPWQALDNNVPSLLGATNTCW